MEKTGFEGCSKSSVADNVIDDEELPADPFDMEIKSTFTAITGWFQDSQENFDDLLEMGPEKDIGVGDYKHFSGFNFVWNSTLRVQQEKGELKIDEISIPYSSFSRYGIGSGDYDGGLASTSDVNNEVVCDVNKEDGFGCGDGGTPHDALFFALGYLGVKDLLVVERVCRSFRDMVRTDPLLWRIIHIDHQLSEKITDDSLAKLTGRAQGMLQCLSLVECTRISDSGLRRVLETNLSLTKLSVPGCSNLSIEGILRSLRAFNSTGSPGIKHLRIGDLFNVTNKQFKELKCLLNADDNVQKRTLEPQFYRWGQYYLPCDDDRDIDIETCPKCKKLGLVYDCPAKSCQAKHDAAQLCRACRLCVSRCFRCGRCFEDCDYEETFSLDLFCLDCLKQLLIYEEKMELRGASSSKRTIFCQETRYEFCFYG